MRIWNTAKGLFSSVPQFILLLNFPNHFRRKVHENFTCTHGLCHSRPFQQRCYTHRLLCPGWSHVRSLLSLVPLSHIHHHFHSRIWNTSDGQCLKTLAEGHDAIWCVQLIIFYVEFSKKLHACLANMSSSLRTQNIFCRQLTTALFDSGITKARGA